MNQMNHENIQYFLHPDKLEDLQKMASPPQLQKICLKDDSKKSGFIILNCEEQQLKADVPVAEWYIIMRQIKSLSPFVWIDAENKCMASFKPYINDNTFEVAIELSPINTGARFNDMSMIGKKNNKIW